MEFFFWIIVLGALAGIASMARWGVLGFGAAHVGRLAQRQFSAQLQQAIRIGRELPQLPPGERAAAQAELSALLRRVDVQWQQLDPAAKGKHEVAMDDLMGTAARAGIDWHPAGT
jgi:hypothetical protein